MELAAECTGNNNSVLELMKEFFATDPSLVEYLLNLPFTMRRSMMGIQRRWRRGSEVEKTVGLEDGLVLEEGKPGTHWVTHRWPWPEGKGMLGI
jgi:hypothetical protein